MTKIEVDAFPDTSFGGEVIEIGNTALTSGLGTQDQTTNFRVKIVFQDADVAIRPGMSADVDITTSKHDQVLAVPFSAVVIRSFDLDSLEAARLAEDTNDEAGATDLQAAEGDSLEVVDSEKKKDVKREELKGVFVIRDGKTRFTQVKTGIADHSHIEIYEGLQVDDSVVTGPYRVLRTVKDGDEVKVESDEEDNN
jgi:HlyD family secretion protein